jgi:hypothetical protein
VTAATGNFSNAGTASIGGNLSAVGDFAINTNKFNVTAATGNASSAGNYALAGRLNIGGATDANNYAINSAAGHIVASGTWGLQTYGVGTPGAANVEYLYINHNGATPFISVDKVGSGSYRGLEIKTGGSTAITVSTTQGVQLASTLGVTGATTLSSTLGVTGVITAANRSSLGSVYPQSNAVVKVGGTSAITQGGGSTQYGVLLTHSSGTDGSNVLTGLYAVCEATVTCTTVNSINIATNIKAAGTVTDNHGLKIENQTVGTNNWAIKTGTGLIEFGDTVQKTTSGEFLIRNINNAGGSSGGVRLYTSSGDIKLEAVGLVQIVTTGTGLAITGATTISGNLEVNGAAGISTTRAGNFSINHAGASGSINLTSSLGDVNLQSPTTIYLSAPDIIASRFVTLEGISGRTIKYTNGVSNGSVATTLGSVGPTGSSAGNPSGWIRISIAGSDKYIPYW